MQTRFVCLANSFKEGGRCIAGIELDANNNAIFIGGRPKWIRPVHSADHGQIPNHIAESLQILHIVQIDITSNNPQGYQSENANFKLNSLKIIGNFNYSNLNTLCEIKKFIFGNRGKAVSGDAIENLNYSLMLIDITQFEITQIVYDDNPSKPKTRLVFQYNGNRYDLPITDPSFLNKYQHNKEILDDNKQIFLTLSLGIELEDWYYKLVAAVIHL